MTAITGSLPLAEGKKNESIPLYLSQYTSGIQINKQPAEVASYSRQTDLKAEIFSILFDACLNCAVGLSSDKRLILSILGSKAGQIMIDWRCQQIPGVFVDYGRAVHELTGELFKQRCNDLLITLIAAARVNGHTGGIPQQGLLDLLEKYEMNAGVNELIYQELNKPLTARRIASLSGSPVASAELYLFTLLIIDPEIVQQNMYLFLLAEELLLPDAVIYQLEHQARLLLTLESLYENFGIKMPYFCRTESSSYN